MFSRSDDRGIGVRFPAEASYFSILHASTVSGFIQSHIMGNGVSFTGRKAVGA
jgi:hypothetical protein